MIQIYTTPSCASCRKAKKWFDQYNIPYSEKNIFSIKLSKDDIYRMLANSENGFDDIKAETTNGVIVIKNNLYGEINTSGDNLVVDMEKFDSADFVNALI